MGIEELRIIVQPPSGTWAYQIDAHLGYHISDGYPSGIRVSIWDMGVHPGYAFGVYMCLRDVHLGCKYSSGIFTWAINIHFGDGHPSETSTSQADMYLDVVIHFGYPSEISVGDVHLGDFPWI